MDRTLFPLQEVVDFLRSMHLDLSVSPLGVSWPTHGGVTRIEISRLDFATTDGMRVSEEVRMTFEHPHLPVLSDELVALFNRWSTFSAFVVMDADRPPLIVSKVGIFDQDVAAAAATYAPLIANAAVKLGWHTVMMASGRFEEADTEEEGNEGALACWHGPEGVLSLKALSSELERYSELSVDTFTVEFPWDEGAITNLLMVDSVREAVREEGALSEEELEAAEGKTSLLRLQLVSHPLYGAGIQSTLEIPHVYDQDEGPRLANELNLWELSRPDLPPMLGAWCDGPRSLAFVTFVPSKGCFPGLLKNLYVWSLWRHRWVKQWLMNAPTFR